MKFQIRYSFPFDRMKVGDYLYANCSREYCRAQEIAIKHGKRHGMKFKSEKVGTHWEIRRVE